MTMNDEFDFSFVPEDLPEKNEREPFSVDVPEEEVTFGLPEGEEPLPAEEAAEEEAPAEETPEEEVPEEETPAEEEASAEEETPDEEEKTGFAVDTSAAEHTIPDYHKTAKPVYDFETEPKKKQRRHKRGFGCLGSTIYLLVVLALAAGISFFALGVVRDITGISKEDAEISVDIPEGATLTSIAKILKEEGLIDSEFGLVAYAKLTKIDYMYQPGTFTLNAKWGYKEMLKAMAVQQVIRETVKVRIVEGKTINSIAAILEENGVCKADDFIDALKTHDYTKYDFIAELPENPDRLYALEGYLFPDTYEFFKESDVDSVVYKFLDNFDKRFSKELRDEAREQGMTVDDVVKFASVVQKEGGSEKTMRMVAGVFHNRLNNNNYLFLQSNATLSYALGVPILWMTEEQMNDPSPYNTYLHKGLPPSAICNPGLQAIKAVLDPDDNDYYFFVTDEESRFYFSKTANEHEKYSNAIRNGPVDTSTGVI